MGCDIHAHLEIKIAGKWEHYSTLNIRRNYWLFGRMAGVLGDAEPIAQPRGLPSDISLVTKMEVECYGEDGHTHSWLTPTEVGSVQAQHESQAPDGDEMSVWRQWGYLFGNSIGGWVKHPKDYPAAIEDVRLVFWFDN